MMESVSLCVRAILSCRCSHRFHRCHHAAVVFGDAEAYMDDFDVEILMLPLLLLLLLLLLSSLLLLLRLTHSR